jgi:flagellin-specific chaperone FliS
MSELEEAIVELERAAERLRADDIEPDEAADLIERCAQIAARLGAALDRQAAAPGEASGQERLL